MAAFQCREADHIPLMDMVAVELVDSIHRVGEAVEHMMVVLLQVDNLVTLAAAEDNMASDFTSLSADWLMDQAAGT